MFRYQVERPNGSIEIIDHIKLAFDCVKKDRSEVPFYIVEQMGHIKEFLFTPNETIIKDDSIAFGYPCPYCGELTYADYVDIGVGMEQVSPYSCLCGALQIGPYDDIDPNRITKDELDKGWYKPYSLIEVATYVVR